MWAWWLANPCCLRRPNSLHGRQNQKWPTCGHSGYLTPAVSGVPFAFNGGENQKWPTHGQSGYLTPVVSGVPNALHEDKIRSAPHVGIVAT